MFADRVVYASVKDEEGDLQKLATELVKHFEAAGLNVCGNRSEFVPHVTLAKPSRKALQQVRRLFVFPPPPSSSSLFLTSF